MKNIVKKLLLGVAIGFCVLFPGESLANTTDQKTVYEEICEVRKYFCGAAGVGIVTGVIVVIGILLFSGKVDISVVMVTLVGIVVFISADLLIEAMFNPPAGAGVVQSCRCS